MEELVSKYKAFIVLMFIYWFICFIMLFQASSFLYAMLAWNVFLAFLPLYFIKKAEYALRDHKRGWMFFWSAVWLLFFPNSVYLITDFIHISNDTFKTIVEIEQYPLVTDVIYHQEIMIWTKLLVIGLGFFLAACIGFESLYRFEQNIKSSYSAKFAYISVVIVTILTGLGVYIGRFLRFNSWDLFFNPFQLFKQIFALDAFAWQFLAAFSGFVGGCYIIYRSVRKRND